MNIPRIFAHAVARRVAYVVVGAVFLFLAQCVNEAKAQDCGIPLMPTVPGASPTRTAELALQECNAFPGVVKSAGTSWHDRYSSRTCTLNEAAKNVTIRYEHIGVWSSCSTNASGPDATKKVSVTGWGWNTYCPTGKTWNAATQKCELPPNCDVLDPPLSGGWIQTANSSAFLTCQGGCAYIDADGDTLCSKIDGAFFCSVAGWQPTGETCTAGPGDGVEPPTDSDGDGKSDGNDPAPNNPGDNGDTGNEDDSEKEPTCGGPGQPACQEGEGDGKGSGNGNTSGGGGDCQTPPHSSGDAILAQIAFQTWATRCAIAGKANQGPGGQGDGDGDNGEQPDWTKGSPPPMEPDDGDDDVTRFGLGLNPSMLDEENIFGEGSCPVFEIPIYGGGTISTAEMPWWCDAIAILRALIMLFGAYTALQILMGRNS